MFLISWLCACGMLILRNNTTNDCYKLYTTQRKYMTDTVSYIVENKSWEMQKFEGNLTNVIEAEEKKKKALFHSM